MSPARPPGRAGCGSQGVGVRPTGRRMRNDTLVKGDLVSVPASVRRLTAAGVLAAALVGAAALPAAAAGRPAGRPHHAVSTDARHFPYPGDRWGRDHRRGWDHRGDDWRYGHRHGWDGRFGDHDHRGHRWH